MRGYAVRTREVARAVYRELRAENVTFMAGSIAYHAFVSVLPFLALVLVVVAAFGGEQRATAIVRFTEAYLTPSTRTLLADAAEKAASDAGVSLVGALALVWGTSKIFRGLDQAFSDIYETQAANTPLDQAQDAGVVALALGLAVVAVGLVREAVTLPGAGPLEPFVNVALLGIGLAAAFLPLYYVFPDADVTVREILPGAAFAGFGWAVLETAFRLYTQRAGGASELYGFVGAILALLTFFYFSGLLLLTGAALNAVLAGRSQDVAAIDWGLDLAAAAATEAGAGGGDGTAVSLPADALSDLDAALSGDEPITVTVGEGEEVATVTLPPPTEVAIEENAVRRPAWLGGGESESVVTLRWEA